MKERQELLDRIAVAESARDAGEETDVISLAHDYFTLALEAQEVDDYEKTGEILEKVINLLGTVSFPTDEMILLLAQARLTYGIVFNDQGMWNDALAEYDTAESLLEKLSDAGNLDARLDLAGIRLNIATIKFELGEYSDSMAAFEQVKSDFASLFGTPKEAEAYYYLAKTYMQEALVCREIGEDEKGIQRLEEGIALYRKMIEQGDAEQSIDLAQALAVYSQTIECSGGKEPAEILPFVEESIARLREGIGAGRADVCPDLLTISVMKGRLLNYLDRREESEEFLTETAEIFDGVQETDDPEALLTFITLYDERGKSRYARENLEEALADFTEAAQIAARLPPDFYENYGHGHDCDDECCCGHLHVLRAEGLLDLFSVYVNRAKVLRLLNRLDDAKGDCAEAAKILSQVKDYLEDDYQGYLDIYDALVKSLS